MLAGGRSRRMGSDKAVLDVGGLTLVERAVLACRAAGAEPVAVVGHRRPDTLPPGLEAALVADLHPGEGPLGGILTALRWSPARATLVVACDLPFVTGELLGSLVAALDTGRPSPSGADAALARSSRGVEPLIGVWRAEAATALREGFVDGRRAIVDVLGPLTVVEVDADDRAVANVNLPSELAAVRRGHGRWCDPG